MHCRRGKIRDQGGVMPPLRVLLVVMLLVPLHAAVADDAQVLPQGVFHLSVEASFSFPVTERFTSSGGTEALATDFNRDLNSTVFSNLRLVEAAFRLPEGSATFGRSVVDFTRHIQIYTVRAAYGLTDRLSLGVRVPYWTQENRVHATLDTAPPPSASIPRCPVGSHHWGSQGRGRPRPRISRRSWSAWGFDA